MAPIGPDVMRPV